MESSQDDNMSIVDLRSSSSIISQNNYSQNGRIILESSQGDNIGNQSVRHNNEEVFSTVVIVSKNKMNNIWKKEQRVAMICS